MEQKRKVIPPVYFVSALALILVDVALLFGTLARLVPIPEFVWIIHGNFIRGEERFLENIFGDQYLTYKRRVRQWV